MNLAEQFRPRQWSEVVGQRTVLERIATLRTRGLAGRAYWLSGPSGAGKTTMARLIAAEVADDWSTVELDGGQVDSAVLADLERDCRTRPLGRGCCLVVNEAHGLRAPTIRRLLVLLESLPSWVTVIFTTTTEGQLQLFDERIDAHPLLSRCVVLELKPVPTLDAACHCRKIARSIGLDGRPLECYKERPDVRARRIKTIEAEIRKIERSLAQREECRKLWEKVQTLEQARIVSERTEAGWLSCCKHPTLDQYLHPSDVLPFDDRSDYAKEHYPTWTLAQVKERAADAYKVPGPDSYSSRWLVHLANRLAYERAMLAEDGGTVADQNRPERGGACRCWCSPGYGRGWSYIRKVNKVSVTVEDNWGNGGKNFTRTIPFDKLKAVMSAAAVADATAAGRVHDCTTGFYLDEPSETQYEAKVHREAAKAVKDDSADFEAMEQSLRSGVQVMSAPQLFPTPVALAARMVQVADIRPTHTVLEPSAGTGRLIDAARRCYSITAVEVNHQLADGLKAKYPLMAIHCRDFLECNGDLGQFDRIVMNPPFKNGSDIKHIEHARRMLKPGGRIVAICAAGPRQRKHFVDDAETAADQWIDLPQGSFEGTNVNAAIVVIDANTPPG